MTLDVPAPDPDDEVVLGVTHLLIGGELMPLYKCPFCSFRNIHEDEITHHIRYKEDKAHDVDADKIDTKTYIVTKDKNRGHYNYENKVDLPLPYIKCLWCDSRDKIVRDLEYHFLAKHRDRLNKIKVSPEMRRQDRDWTRDPFSWMYSDIEYRLYKASRLAKRKSGITK